MELAQEAHDWIARCRDLDDLADQDGIVCKPKIHWHKDRSKDPESASWFQVFGGDRINDYHLSLEEKREAKDRGTPVRALGT
jgi:hypothetical protein